MLVCGYIVTFTFPTQTTESTPTKNHTATIGKLVLFTFPEAGVKLGLCSLFLTILPAETQFLIDRRDKTHFFPGGLSEYPFQVHASASATATASAQ